MERGLNNSYPESFRQQVLEDYFSSNGTIKACASFGQVPMRFRSGSDEVPMEVRGK